MPKIIIGLVGQIASGKGTATKYLEEKHSAGTHRFSTMLRDVLKRLYLETSRENMQALSTFLRKQFGEDALARVIAKEVAEDPKPVVAVDGIRRLADIKYLKELAGFKLVRIVADPKARYERLVARKENAGDALKTYEEFLADQEQEADAEIPAVMAQAELELNNDGLPEDLYRQIEKIVRPS